MTPSPNFQSRILFKNLGQHSELEIKLELEQEPMLQLELELDSELEPAQSELEWPSPSSSSSSNISGTAEWGMIPPPRVVILETMKALHTAHRDDIWRWRWRGRPWRW